jgi:hypothetical protein
MTTDVNTLDVDDDELGSDDEIVDEGGEDGEGGEGGEDGEDGRDDEDRNIGTVRTKAPQKSRLRRQTFTTFTILKDIYNIAYFYHFKFQSPYFYATSTLCDSRGSWAGARAWHPGRSGARGTEQNQCPKEFDSPGCPCRSVGIITLGYDF